KAKLEGLSGLNVPLGSGSMSGATKTLGKAPDKFDPVTGYTPSGEWSDIGDTGWKVATEDGGWWGPTYVAYDPAGHPQGMGANWTELVPQLEGKEYEKMVGTGEYESDPFGTIKSNYKTSLTDLHSK